MKKRKGKMLPLMAAGVLCGLLTFPVSADEGQESIVPEVSPSGQLQLSEYQKSMYEYPDLPAVSMFGILPDKFDLRDQGDVTSVKDQGIWGTCWAFGFLSSAEGGMLKEYDMETDLSEHHLSWFETQPEMTGSQQGEGVGYTKEYPLMAGGNDYMSISILGAWKGAATEEEVPYADKSGETGNPNGDWSVDESKRYTSSYQLQNVDMLPIPTIQEEDGSYVYRQEATDIMKQVLMDKGVLCISYYADQSMPGEEGDATYFNYNTGAQYVYEYQPLNHLVSIVGWDDNYSKENFNKGHQPEGDGAWIVKNSWGSQWGSSGRTDWGEEGYFYLSYYDRSIASVSQVDMLPSDWGNDHNYQYDYLGAALSMDMPVDSGANVFTAQNAEALKAVSAMTTEGNMTVRTEIYKLGEDGKSPADGEKVYEQEDYFPYSGYHVIKLKESVMLEAGEKFAVAQTILDSEGNSRVGIELGLQENLYDFTYNARINEGESFVKIDGQWVDQITNPFGLDIIDGLEVNIGNLLIKAFTDDIPTAELGMLKATVFDAKDQQVGETLEIAPEDSEVSLSSYTNYVIFEPLVQTENGTAKIQLGDREIQAGEKIYRQDLEGKQIEVVTSVEGGTGKTYTYTFTLDDTVIADESGKVTIVDAHGVVPHGTVLSAVETEEGEEYETVEREKGKMQIEDFTLLSVETLWNGQPFELNEGESVMLAFQLPANRTKQEVKLYYLDMSGEEPDLELLNTASGELSVSRDKINGWYVLAETAEGQTVLETQENAGGTTSDKALQSAPKTGDSQGITVVIGMAALIASAMAAAGAVTYRRRRK